MHPFLGNFCHVTPYLGKTCLYTYPHFLNSREAWETCTYKSYPNFVISLKAFEKVLYILNIRGDWLKICHFQNFLVKIFPIQAAKNTSFPEKVETRTRPIFMSRGLWGGGGGGFLTILVTSLVGLPNSY